EGGDFIRQLGVRERLNGPGDRAVVDQRLLVCAAGLDVTVEAVVRRVAFSADEPAAVDAGLRIEHSGRGAGPFDFARGGFPEGRRILLPRRVHVVIPAVHTRSRVTLFN